MEILFQKINNIKYQNFIFNENERLNLFNLSTHNLQLNNNKNTFLILHYSSKYCLNNNFTKIKIQRNNNNYLILIILFLIIINLKINKKRNLTFFQL